MPKKVVIGQTHIVNEYTAEIGVWLFIPVLVNTTSAPIDNTKVALGVFDEILYKWNTISLEWEAIGDNPYDLRGNGSPEGLAAPVGATYRQLDGSAGAVFWVNQSGTDGSGWAPLG